MNTEQDPRFVSRLTRNTLALILAGGRGSRLRHLTAWRAKPAVPFGGKFRIVDFPLSNCMNSGIRRIGVLTQYKSHSLNLHIQRGWGFLRGEFGEFVELLPAQQRIEANWYEGTADAVYQNLDILRNHNPEFVLVLAGDHIYRMDYGTMIAQHVESRADMTVGCIEVDLETAKAFGVMSVDDDGRVREFQEKPQDPRPSPGHTDRALASMGIYIVFDLFEQDRSEVHHRPRIRIGLQVRHHVHVVLYSVQIDPGQLVFVVASPAIVGLVHVPAQNDLEAASLSGHSSRSVPALQAPPIPRHQASRRNARHPPPDLPRSRCLPES